MAARPVENAGALVNLNADLYRFELELVRHGEHLIAALPVAANADIWLVRGVAGVPLAR